MTTEKEEFMTAFTQRLKDLIDSMDEETAKKFNKFINSDCDFDYCLNKEDYDKSYEEIKKILGFPEKIKRREFSITTYCLFRYLGELIVVNNEEKAIPIFKKMSEATMSCMKNII